MSTPINSYPIPPNFTRTAPLRWLFDCAHLCPIHEISAHDQVDFAWGGLFGVAAVWFDDWELNRSLDSVSWEEFSEAVLLRFDTTILSCELPLPKQLATSWSLEDDATLMGQRTTSQLPGLTLQFLPCFLGSSNSLLLKLFCDSQIEIFGRAVKKWKFHSVLGYKYRICSCWNLLIPWWMSESACLKRPYKDLTFAHQVFDKSSAISLSFPRLAVFLPFDTRFEIGIVQPLGFILKNQCKDLKFALKSVRSKSYEEAELVWVNISGSFFSSHMLGISTKVVGINYRCVTEEEMEAWSSQEGNGESFSSGGRWEVQVSGNGSFETEVFEIVFLIPCVGKYNNVPNISKFVPGKGLEVFRGRVIHSMEYLDLGGEEVEKLVKGNRGAVVGLQQHALAIIIKCSFANSKKNPCIVVYKSHGMFHLLEEDDEQTIEARAYLFLGLEDKAVVSERSNDRPSISNDSSTLLRRSNRGPTRATTINIKQPTPIACSRC